MYVVWQGRKVWLTHSNLRIRKLNIDTRHSHSFTWWSCTPQYNEGGNLPAAYQPISGLVIRKIVKKSSLQLHSHFQLLPANFSSAASPVVLAVPSEVFSSIVQWHVAVILAHPWEQTVMQNNRDFQKQSVKVTKSTNINEWKKNIK